MDVGGHDVTVEMKPDSDTSPGPFPSWFRYVASATTMRLGLSEAYGC